MGSFAQRFPGFRPESPETDAQAYLLARFQRRLTVQTLPRTLILQIRFRSQDPALCAAVVNAMIRAYVEQNTDARVQATADATGRLDSQLQALKAKVDSDDRRLMKFQEQHGLLDAPEMLANGHPGDVQHAPALLEIDELGRELAAATSDRILREAEYRAALRGDPEMVLASDPRLQNESGNSGMGLLQHLRSRRSDLQQEQVQLSMEHGPNFPRVVEIRGELEDIDRQIRGEDAKLVEQFHDALQTAADREQLVRQSLAQSTSEGMKLNEAATQYAVMRQEAEGSRELYHAGAGEIGGSQV